MAIEWLRLTKSVLLWRGGVFLGGVGGFSRRKEPGREGVVLRGGGFCDGGSGCGGRKRSRRRGTRINQLASLQEFHKINKFKVAVLRESQRMGGGRSLTFFPRARRKSSSTHCALTDKASFTPSKEINTCPFYNQHQSDGGESVRRQ
jgi:hypothetical protein